MTKLKTIILENDIIEILYNKNLTNKPYLLRLVNYNNELYEMRADADDLKKLRDIISDIFRIKYERK
jgi:hypothetical protein